MRPWWTDPLVVGTVTIVADHEDDGVVIRVLDDLLEGRSPDQFDRQLGAAQFALPGAVDRLRAVRERGDDAGEVLVLAATDPAQPCGAAVDWPAALAGLVNRGQFRTLEIAATAV